MAKTSFYSKGFYITTMEKFAALEKDPAVQYFIKDAPDSSITNAQMADAIEKSGYNGVFVDGDLYVCIDSGNYKQNHIYQFLIDTTTDPFTYSWKDLSLSSVGDTIILNPEGWAQETDGTYSFLYKLNRDDSKIQVQGFISNQTEEIAKLVGLHNIGNILADGTLEFISDSKPDESIEITITGIEVENEQTKFVIENAEIPGNTQTYFNWIIYPRNFEKLENPIGEYSYVGYYYNQNIVINSIPDVIFSKEDLLTGNFGIVESMTGALKVYSKKIPEKEVLLEKVSLTKF